MRAPRKTKSRRMMRSKDKLRNKSVGASRRNGTSSRSEFLSISPLGRKILKFLLDFPDANDRQSLLSALKLKKKEVSILNSEIQILVSTGFVNLSTEQRLSLDPRVSRVDGKVTKNRQGYGFLSRHSGRDLFVSREEMRGVLSGDNVVAIGIPDRAGELDSAIVIEALRADDVALVGVFESQNRKVMLRAIDQDTSVNLVHLQSEEFVPAVGDVFELSIKDFLRESNTFLVELSEFLGRIDEPGIEVKIAIRKFGIPHVWPETVAEGLGQYETSYIPADSNRRDLRNLPFVTIDGESAKDFDDAVLVERQSYGFLLRVAIADVAHYVQPGGRLDSEAANRGTSVYFPTKVVPMLPEELSNDLCSLRPQLDRLVVVYEARLSERGEVLSDKFFEGVINSKARLTYGYVQSVLDSDHPGEFELTSEILENLISLKDLTSILLLRRFERGALDIDMPEYSFNFSADGEIDSVEVTRRFFSQKMIEEAMLCANTGAARFLQSGNYKFLYRTHPAPTFEAIDKLNDLLLSFGIEAIKEDPPETKNFQRVLTSCAEKPFKAIVHGSVLRSMKQATYSPDNQGHFGLAYDAYTHFTSPIRRYPDLLVHRIIKSVLAKGRVAASDLISQGVQTSRAERRAEEASRWVSGWLKAKIARKHIGDSFDGRVSSVTSFGLFVYLDYLHIEGLLHISDLGHEFLEYDDRRKLLFGRSSGLSYRVGDAIEVQIVDADLYSGEITLMSPKKRRGKRR